LGKKINDLHPTSFLDMANILVLEIVEISFDIQKKIDALY